MNKHTIITIIAFATIFSPFVASAWSGPTNSVPPNDNVLAPVNIGGSTQTKAGVLNVNGLRSYVDARIDGNVGIGTFASYKLHVAGSGSPAIYLQNLTSGNGATVAELTSAGVLYHGWQNSETRFRTGSADRMTIASTGNVGIGLINPSSKLEVSGDIKATAFYYTSDKSLKSNISPITNALANIKKLQGVSFTWKNNGNRALGLVAQDVEKVYPELVSTNNEGVKSVQYGNLVAPLIEAIKEQQKQIDALRAEIEALKSVN